MKRAGFTLVEIMIVVAIIALLAAIAVPNFLRARKRSQMSLCEEDCRLLEDALHQYGIETNKVTNDGADFGDLKNYIKAGTTLYSSGETDGVAKDPLGHAFVPFKMDASGTPSEPPSGDHQFFVDWSVNWNQATYDELKDVIGN